MPSALSDLLQFPVLLWLLCLVALATLWRHRQEKRRRLLVLTAAFAVLTLYCVPVMAYLLLRPLEAPYPPLAQRPTDVTAIVVLGGGVREAEAEGLPAEPSEDSVFRCLRAAQMYHQGPPCPVIVSGGKVDPASSGPPVARVMRDFLVRQGVPAGDVIVEDSSRDTYENAVQSTRILRERGLGQVLLVTDAVHLERSLRCFRKQGVEAVPCGCRYATLHFEWATAEFLPNPNRTRGMWASLHEWVGMAWYTLRGRI